MLGGVTLVFELGTLRDKTLAALAAAVLEDSTTGFRGHTGTESVLTGAAASRWLESAFHDKWSLRELGAPCGAGAHSTEGRTLVNPPICPISL